MSTFAEVKAQLVEEGWPPALAAIAAMGWTPEPLGGVFRWCASHQRWERQPDPEEQPQ